MAEVTLFHFRDRDTMLNRSHPLTKIICMLAFSTTLASPHLPRSTAMLVILVIIAAVIRLPFTRYGKELQFFLIMGSIMGMARALGATSWTEPVTVILRFASIVIMGLVFADTTAPDDLSRSIGHMLEPILHARGYRIGVTLELTLATVPLLLDVASEVSDARKARGESVWRHPIGRIVSYGSTVFTLLLQRAEELEAALRARSFNPDAPRDGLGFSTDDVMLALISTILLSGLWILM